MIYWDYNSTSPLRKRVKEKMASALDAQYANPNSSHSLGQSARHAIEKARRTLAKSMGCEPGELIFSASATESNLMALWGHWMLRSQQNPEFKKILASPIEHSSVHENLLCLQEKFGAQIVFTPLDKDGLVDLEKCEKLLSEGGYAFCTVMGAHNETGVIQPWQKLSEICKNAKVPYHSDLVQCFGRIPFKISESQISTGTISFHKAGGPKGVSVLYIRKGVQIEPVIRGGAQEKKRRAGTENILAIIGAEALAEEIEELNGVFSTSVKLARDRLEKEILASIPSAKIVGKNAPRIPNTSYIIFPGIKADAMVMNLDLQGACVGTGSACASGMVLPSRTLLQLGYSETDALGAIRFSFGPENLVEEVVRMTPLIQTAVSKLTSAAA
ncbi:MAG: cysteine desulfurase [Deltaproteobacteria bacterium]|nr:cysteine desulfurase [Deltaproteobacteria bacterium]